MRGPSKPFGKVLGGSRKGGSKLLGYFNHLCEDDGEYDYSDWPARSNFGEGSSVKAGNFELDPNARHRLAVARIKMGDVEERKVSFLNFFHNLVY